MSWNIVYDSFTVHIRVFKLCFIMLMTTNAECLHYYNYPQYHGAILIV